MVVYVDLVFFLNFFVDFLLIIGTNRLCGFPSRLGRSVLAAGVGGLYGAMCMLPQCHFLGNMLWRLVSLGIISWIAFGAGGMIRRGTVFVLLCMSLGGIALGLGAGNGVSVLSAAAMITLMCGVGFRNRIGSVAYIPVELNHCGQHLRLTALEDTGNTLRDPVTGRPVLVVGANIASRLVGLTPEQLRSPVESLYTAGIPGLRLIPYRGVGQQGGFLLAMRLEDVRIGQWKGSSLVAFAAETMENDGYQALTGGIVG